MNQLINSLCRGNEVDPGESLADTAAQSGIIDVRLFRKAEEALFHKFGHKPPVIPGDNQAVGIGGRAKVLGKVGMPSGMGGVNGIVKSDLLFDDQLAQRTPGFECSFASGFDVNANSAWENLHWSQRFGGEDLLFGAWFTSPERRGKSCWTRGN